jgi:hypothetical protein
MRPLEATPLFLPLHLLAVVEVLPTTLLLVRLAVQAVVVHTELPQVQELPIRALREGRLTQFSDKVVVVVLAVLAALLPLELLVVLAVLEYPQT